MADLDPDPPNSPHNSSDSLDPFTETEEDGIQTSTLTVETARDYWNSISLEEKRDFLKVNINLFEAFVENKSITGRMKETLECYSDHGHWSFFVCGPCSKRFSCRDLYFEHVMKHVFSENFLSINVPKENEFLLPVEVDSEWISVMNLETWKPVCLGDPCDTSKREKKLGIIRRSLQTMLFNDILLGVHVSYLHNLVKKLLNSDIREMFREDLNVTHIYKCICMFGSKELDVILKFLNKSREVGEKHIVFDTAHERKHAVVAEDDNIYVLFPEHTFDDDSAEYQIHFPSWIFEDDCHFNPWTWYDDPEKSLSAGNFLLKEFHLLFQRSKSETDEELFVHKVAKLIYAVRDKLDIIGKVDYFRLLRLRLKLYLKERLEDCLRKQRESADTDQPYRSYNDHWVNRPSQKRKDYDEVPTSVCAQKRRSDAE